MKSTSRTRLFLRSALIFISVAASISLPVWGDAKAKNGIILPPSMRPKVQAAIDAEASSEDVKNYRLYQEWKKSKNQRNVKYEEFLLWQESIKTQKNN